MGNVAFARLFAHYSDSVTDRHPKLGPEIRSGAFYENKPRFLAMIKHTIHYAYTFTI